MKLRLQFLAAVLSLATSAAAAGADRRPVPPTARPNILYSLAALLQRTVAEGRSTPGPALANDVEVTLPPLTSITQPPR